MRETLQVSCVQNHWAKSVEENLEKTMLYIQEAKKARSNVVLFPEANLTSYYFPYVIELDQQIVQNALAKVCKAANENHTWVIVGTIQKTADKHLNLAHVIAPSDEITYEYAKVQLAGSDEKKVLPGGE